MKKAFTIFLILAALSGIGYGVKIFLAKQNEEQRIEEAKKGWHVEVLTEYINVREKPDRYSREMSKVYQGDIYKVIENDLSDPNLYWYLVEFNDGSTGWIANNTSGTYLKDNNNPNDIAIPIIKFDEAEYERKCDEYLKTIGYFDDGHAAEAVVDVILEKAGLL